MPNISVMAFSDPDERQDKIRASDNRMTLTKSGQYQASHTWVDLGQLWLQRGCESLPLVSFSALHKHRRPVFFLADTDQASFTHRGVDVSPAEMVFNSPEAEYHHRYVAPPRWASMSLSADGLAAAGNALIGYDVTAPAATKVIRPSPTHLSRLRNLHRAAGNLAASTPDILAHPEVAKAIEQALVEAMLACVDDGSAGSTTNIGHQRASVMRRFEQLLEADVDRTLYLAEVCAAIGVSERTLRTHCQDHLGMSPHRYLWMRRMHLARRALTLADPKATTVTMIANDHGFGELGRFAVEYRKLFGELPSATLRGPPERGPIEPSPLL